MIDRKIRCEWVSDDSAYIDYHDDEWGRPIYDDRMLFEFLCLEGAQAGLSWITILKRREGYRRCFDNFDIHKIVKYNDKKIEKLLQDTGIIRNRLKVNSVITNAKACLNMMERGQTFSDYIWSFVDGKPIKNHWKSMKQIPVTTPISDQMAKTLKKDGFKFVGSTICYAYMQAAGLVNDHTQDCFCFSH